MEEIILVTQPISVRELRQIAQNRFGDLVKAVVDIEKEIMALGGELHADEEAFLLEQGSSQANLWGINLYPDLEVSNRIEFDSMINIRPSQNNPSRFVEDPIIQQQIKEIVSRLIT